MINSYLNHKIAGVSKYKSDNLHTIKTRELTAKGIIINFYRIDRGTAN